MTILINILLGLYVVDALLMMLVILMQRPKSEGLGAAFGGGVTENIFGAQTTNVLTKITGWLAAIFFLVTFILSILYARKANTPSSLTRELTQGQTPVPAATATPVPGSSATPSANGTVTPAAAGTAMPSASPGPSSAVGPPGTVTNMTPGATSPAPSVRPSDQAVGAIPVTTPPPATSPAPSTAPSVSASPQP